MTITSSDHTGPPFDCGGPPANLAALTYCSPGQSATSNLLQRTKGFGIQLTDSQNLFGSANQAVVGADYNDSDDTFSQAYQYGQLTPDRMLIYEASPFNDETVISLTGSNKIYGAYLTDTLSPSKLLHFTASLRYNRNTETLNGYSIDTDIGDFGAGFNQAERTQRRSHFQPSESRFRIYGDTDRCFDFLCRLQRSEPRANGH